MLRTTVSRWSGRQQPYPHPSPHHNDVGGTVKTEYGERRRAPDPHAAAGGALRVAVAVGFEPTVAMNHTAFRVLHLRPLGHATSPDEPAHRGYRTRTDLRNLR